MLNPHSFFYNSHDFWGTKLHIASKTPHEDDEDDDGDEDDKGYKDDDDDDERQR
jgi:hypothetical protein